MHKKRQTKSEQSSTSKSMPTRNTKRGRTTKKSDTNPIKIAIVGAGSVGSATAYTLLLSGYAAEIVLIDSDNAKVEGQCMDVGDAAPLTTDSRLYVGSYSDCSDAAIVIIAGGSIQEPQQTNKKLAEENIEFITEVVPQIAKHAPNTIMIIATSPVDVLTFASLKLSGFPTERVIGTGTMLNTARLKHHLGEYFDLSADSIHAFVVGEYGGSEMAVWSLATIGGMRIPDFCKQAGLEYDSQAMVDIFERTRSAGQDIVERKGCSEFGIAAVIQRIVKAILTDEGSLLTVSTVNTFYGVEDVAFSVPVKVDRSGAHKLLDLALEKAELAESQKAGQGLKAACEELDF